MKNLLSILFLFCLSLSLQAQVAPVLMTTTGGGSIVNTDTATAIATLKGSYKTVTFTAYVTKVSGVVAGTITVQGSIDGTNYETIDTNYVRAPLVGNTSSITVTNTTGTKAYTFILKISPLYYYYRIRYISSGTMSATQTTYVLPRED